MTTTKTIKKIVKKTTPAHTIQVNYSISELGALVRMASREELNTILRNLSVGQINMITDYLAVADSKVSKLKAEIKAIDGETNYLKAPLLEALKTRKQRNVVTPEGNVVEVAPGRASSTFTTTISEFIDIAKDAGCGNNIDDMLSISKTKATEYLGKALVNKITETTREDWGQLKFSSIAMK